MLLKIIFYIPEYFYSKLGPGGEMPSLQIALVRYLEVVEENHYAKALVEMYNKRRTLMPSNS